MVQLTCGKLEHKINAERSTDSGDLVKEVPSGLSV